MSRRKSAVERVVGRVTESQKDDIRDQAHQRFVSETYPELRKIEIQKSNEILELIDLANEITNKILSDFGKEKFDIPPSSIYIIPEDKLNKSTLRKSEAAHFKPKSQIIIAKEQQSKSKMLAILVHEFIHFKAVNSVQKTTSSENQDDAEIDLYRVGFKMYSRDGKKVYFSILNEAITEQLSINYISDISKYSLLEDESEPIYSYKEARESLAILVTKLVAKLKKNNKYPDITEKKVYDLFFLGAIAGNVLPIAKLLNEAFGKHTFRRLGTQGPKGFNLYVQTLQ